jgi:Uncharacterised protein family (UPF0236)
MSRVSRGAKGSPLILAETDGSMVPLVRGKAERDEGGEGRKHKELYWKEARLSLARPIGSVTPCFAATLEGVDKVGEQLHACVEKSGYTEDSRVHCLGDGAAWIANQVEEQFGAQATYLVDFYHVCEYLSEAAIACGGAEKGQWLETQKDHLKSGRLTGVLQALKAHLEDPDKEDAAAPVRRCYRYLDNRRDQLDYARAIEQDLPIGPGEIENAHRHVIQKRLKISGAWWKEANAAHMLALRVNKANRNWDRYWNTIRNVA